MGITTLRSSSLRGGLAAIVAGLLLAVFGFAGPAAGAGQGQGQGQGNERGSITVCHGSNDVDNPYQQNSVSYSAADGTMAGSNHTSHAGPVFDYSADPADLDYPYHPPMSDDDWGDIIPPYEWDGGSFPGQNWDEVGEAIWNADCGDPSDTQIETDVCPEEGVQTDPAECETETDVCPEEGVQTDPADCETETDVCPEDGVQTDPAECETETDVCPQPGVQTDAADCPPQPPVDVCDDVPGLQTDPADCDAELIPPVVIENLPPPAEAPEVIPTVVPRKPVEVQGIQVRPSRQVLPRTGSSTTVMAQIGVGLVLLGAGALVAGRKPAATA